MSAWLQENMEFTCVSPVSSIEDAREGLEVAADMLEAAIAQLEEVNSFLGDGMMDAYLIPHLKIWVGGDDGYLSADKGIRDYLSALDENEDEDEDEDEYD